jgi:hypothetical protein
MSASRPLLSITTALLLAATQAAAQAAPAPAPGPQVSGLIFGNYQYLTGGPSEDFNQFVLDRAYLTVRGTAAPRATYRLTSDVYRSGDANGWTIRLKYGYLDYAIRQGGPWATTLRAGMLQTVVIEHVEAFWPRWLGPVAIDRHGFMSSADVGVASHFALPQRLGEAYVHVVNGPSYTRRESDRFKDFGARLSLTPLASRFGGLAGSLTATGWIYEGATASRFASDPVEPVGDALRRDRAGVLVGIRDRRLTLAAERAWRMDEVESGANTTVDPRIVTRGDGSVTSAFAVARPIAFTRSEGTSPFGLVFRYDRVRPAVAEGDSHYLLAGLLYDVDTRLSVALDYQEHVAASGRNDVGFRGWFANFSLGF